MMENVIQIKTRITINGNVSVKIKMKFYIDKIICNVFWKKDIKDCIYYFSDDMIKKKKKKIDPYKMKLD